MNDDRRKTIEKARSLLADAKALLEEARDGEQDYFDNMPESFQQGEKGTKAEEAIWRLDESVDSLENIEGELEEAVT